LIAGSVHGKSRSVALAVLVAAMATSAAVLIHVGRDQTIRGDELSYAVRLANEPFGHALLHAPPNKYLVAVPLALYDAMFEVFGLGADLPYRIVVTLLVLLCAGLFFSIARRRVGDLLALPPTVLLLFFGSASEVVITAIRIPSLIAVASGLGALIALERRDRWGDIAAAGLLTMSVASHPTGLAFIAAAGVLVALRPSPGGWTKAWVVGVPVAVFAAWWIFLRVTAYDVPGPTGPIDVVGFAWDSWTTLTADFSGLAGVLNGPSFDETIARLAAGVLLALMVIAVATRLRRVPPSVWAAIAALIVLLASTRLSQGAFYRLPDDQRYLYPEGVLFLLVITEVAGLVEIRRWTAAAATVILAFGVTYNLDQLSEGGATARAASRRALAQYSAYEIAGPRLNEDYQPSLLEPPARDYVDAAAAFGSAADSAAELATAPLPVRQVADGTLVGSLGVALRPALSGRTVSRAPQVHQLLSGKVVRGRGCIRLRPEGPPPVSTPMVPLALPPKPALNPFSVGRARPNPMVPQLAELAPVSGHLLLLSPDIGRTAVLLGQFAEPPSAQLADFHGGRAASLRIPPDGSNRPWNMTVASSAPVTVCGLSGR
jgi:hypothetical protein